MSCKKCRSIQYSAPWICVSILSAKILNLYHLYHISLSPHLFWFQNIHCPAALMQSAKTSKKSLAHTNTHNLWPSYLRKIHNLFYLFIHLIHWSLLNLFFFFFAKNWSDFWPQGSFTHTQRVTQTHTTCMLTLYITWTCFIKALSILFCIKDSSWRTVLSPPTL